MHGTVTIVMESFSRYHLSTNSHLDTHSVMLAPFIHTQREMIQVSRNVIQVVTLVTNRIKGGDTQDMTKQHSQRMW